MNLAQLANRFANYCAVAVAFAIVVLAVMFSVALPIKAGTLAFRVTISDEAFAQFFPSPLLLVT